MLAQLFEAAIHYYRLSTSVDIAITMAVIANTQLVIIKPDSVTCIPMGMCHHQSFAGLQCMVGQCSSMITPYR